MKYFTQKSLNELPTPKPILAIREAQRIKEVFEGEEIEDKTFNLNGTKSEQSYSVSKYVKENIANSF
jgi:hypothetical protein